MRTKSHIGMWLFFIILEANSARFLMIFIDANIYLEFYNSNRPEFKKLLKSLVELKKEILVTTQIVDEVHRNKLTVFNTSVSNTLSNVSYKAVVLPSHLDAVDSTLIKSWNEQRKDIERQADLNIANLKAMYSDLFKAISNSSDSISEELDKIFKYAKHYTDDLYALAIVRKQLGNPPGKPKDSMGDQLSWETLLSGINSSTKEIIIITRDTDYYTLYNDNCFLNAQLSKELTGKNADLSIKCFNKLSDALKYYNSTIQIQSLPSRMELEKISKQEPLDFIGAFRPGGLTVVPPVPNVCPVCESKDSFKYPGYNKSLLNQPSTYHYLCIKCGYEYNTNE